MSLATSSQDAAQAVLYFILFAVLALVGIGVLYVIARSIKGAVTGFDLEWLAFFIVPAFLITLILAAAQPSFSLALGWGCGVGAFVFVVGVLVETLKNGRL